MSLVRIPVSNRLMRGLVLAGLLLPLIGGCSAESGKSDPAAASADAGTDASAAVSEDEREVAPDFELVSLSGETVSLSSLRGRTVVIDFWATWCPPCEFQVPELNAFYQAHRGESDVEVLGISVDIEGDDVVGKWAGEKGVEYKVLVDGEDIARLYGAVGFPTLYIITPDGKVDSVHIGLIETGDLEEALARQRASSAG